MSFSFSFCGDQFSDFDSDEEPMHPWPEAIIRPPPLSRYGENVGFFSFRPVSSVIFLAVLAVVVVVVVRIFFFFILRRSFGRI